MVDFSLNLEPSSGSLERDLMLSGGDLVLTADADATGSNPVQQDLSQRLRMFQGEWFLDTSAGVPILQEILVKDPNLGQVDAIVQNTILSTPGVLQLASYSSTYDRMRRRARFEFVVVTQYGTVQYSDVLQATEG